MLEEFEGDLFVHIHLENNILFLKTMEAAKYSMDGGNTTVLSLLEQCYICISIDFLSVKVYFMH